MLVVLSWRNPLMMPASREQFPLPFRKPPPSKVTTSSSRPSMPEDHIAHAGDAGTSDQDVLRGVSESQEWTERKSEAR